ncbi:MAG: substrate-binding domain-containing protein [Saccharofermentanales bacterium]
MFCGNCGNNLGEERIAFCPHCGISLDDYYLKDDIFVSSKKSNKGKIILGIVLPVLSLGIIFGILFLTGTIGKNNHNDQQNKFEKNAKQFKSETSNTNFFENEINKPADNEINAKSDENYKTLPNNLTTKDSEMQEDTDLNESDTSTPVKVEDENADSSTSIPIKVKNQNETVFLEVISKGTEHSFFTNLEKGFQKAADDYNASIHFVGPSTSYDIFGQYDIFSNAISAEPDAICYSPVELSTATPLLFDAKNAGIPVFGFDSIEFETDDLDDLFSAKIFVDHISAGALVAEKLYPSIKIEVDAASSDSKVRIAILAYLESQAIKDRTQGFIDKITDLAGSENVAVIGSSIYQRGNEQSASVLLDVKEFAGDSFSAGDVCESLLSENKDLIAICATNESAVSGMLSGAEENALGNRAEDKSRIWAVGFDAGSAQKRAAQERVMLGSVAIDSVNLGYKTAEIAIKHARGETVEDVTIDSVWYDSNNLSDPDIGILVYD